jgi:hypothetical protein
MKKSKKNKSVFVCKIPSFSLWILGLICGIFCSPGGLISGALVTLESLSYESVSTPVLSIGTVLAFGVLIRMSVLFAIIGFLTGILEAIIHNLWLKYLGIEVDFHKK